MVVLEDRATMVEYTWRRRKVSARLSQWRARCVKSVITPLKRTAVTILGAWN